MKKIIKTILGGESPPKIRQYKIIPLKKIYYNKFKYKININSPVCTSDMYKNSLSIPSKFKYYGQTRTVKEEKEIQKKVIKYRKTISDFLIDLEGRDTSTFYKIYGNVKNLVYGNKHTLYLKTQEEADVAIKHFGDYIKDIEQPINNKHIDICEEDIFLEREIKNKLYFNSYKYKAVYQSYSEMHLREKEHDLIEMFSGRPSSSFFIRLNCYSLSICLNNKEDLLLLKLSTPEISTFYEAILVSELKEKGNE